ncbi:DAZ-associated protein 2 [Condylostylus longicornis]|uniref:DAZ-associated protein 2 n=1 Tax=Condylostylus longicornis TaxID=2530218 RepID=UPI00244E59FE|nr:DAZ-associated protein 2 [Condylostylus longicornis]
MAEKKGVYPYGDYPFAPSAPPPSTSHKETPSYIPDRPPPPSYEESQKQYSNAQHSNVPSAPFGSPAHMPTSSGTSIGYPQMNQGYGHIPVAQSQYPSIIPRPVHQNIQQQQSANKSIHVVQYAAGTRFSGKGGGSVSVPPPPPGIAPTPAQLAALQGQPVILQKKKKIIFLNCI